MPLARLTRRVFTTADPFEVNCEIANYSPAALENATPAWEIVDGPARSSPAATGGPAISLGKNIPLGDISADLSRRTAPQAYKLVVSLKGAAIANDWNFWLYPATLTPLPRRMCS